MRKIITSCRYILLVKLSIILTFVFSLQQTTFANDSQDSKINIVVTSFPIYDYVREIIANTENNYTLSLIIDNGIDLHNYQPSTQDIAEISNADLFIYNGGDSDIWVKKVLSQAMNKDMLQINLMNTLGDKVKLEEIVEGMEEVSHADHNHTQHNHAGHEHVKHDEHEHDKHGHNHDHDHEKYKPEEKENEHIVYDEHVWLSLKNSIAMLQTISTHLQKLDKENAEKYAKNTNDYINKLDKLYKEYDEIFSNAKNKTLIFADRFPFRYLVDEFNLSYYAAFPGCSAETEASFETVIFLSNKVDELAIKKLLIIDSTSEKIAQAIIRTSKDRDAEILFLNSLQTVTAKELAEGISYYSIMQENLKTLHKALD